MRFDRKELKKALVIARKIAKPRMSLSVLAFVRIAITDRGVAIVQATDLEILCKIELNVAPGTQNELIVNAKDLANAIRTGGSHVFLEASSEGVTVDNGGTQRTIDSMNPDDWPMLPETDVELVPVNAREEFTAAIDHVSRAASRDKARYNLNGILLEPHDSGIKLTATDGHRLAQQLVACEAGSAIQKQGCIVPDPFWKILRPLLRSKSTIEIGTDSRFITMIAGNVTLEAKLIEGDYPDYSIVLPKAAYKTRVVTFDRSQAVDTLRAILPNMDEERPKVFISWTEDDVIDVSGDGLRTHFKGRVPTEVAGEPGIALNPRYLLDAIEGLQGVTVDMMIRPLDEKMRHDKPIVFSGDNPNAMALVMPIRSLE